MALIFYALASAEFPLNRLERRLSPSVAARVRESPAKHSPPPPIFIILLKKCNSESVIMSLKIISQSEKIVV